MVSIAEVRPGQTTVLERPTTRLMAIDTGVAPESEPHRIDFLNYHDHILEAEAIASEWEHGRNFLPLITLKFLTTVTNLGIVEKTLAAKDPHEAQIIRRALWFFSCTDASTTEIPTHLEWNMKTDVISKLRNTFKGFHRRAPQDVQNAYPLKSLSLVKEFSQRNRDMQSDAMRRTLGKDPIRKKVRIYREGIDRHIHLTPADIARALGLEGEERSIEIILLEMRKPKQKLLPETRNGKTRRYKQFILEANNPFEIRNALALVSENQIYRNPNIITASAFLRENGFISTGNRAKALANAALLTNHPYRTIAETKTGKNGEKKSKQTTIFLRQQSASLLKMINRLPMLKAFLIDTKNNNLVDIGEAAM